MPNGKTHDRLTIATAALSLPIWIILTPDHDPFVYSVGVGSYLFSGIWLSGDLDTSSICYKRWGLFKFIWLPYRLLIPHRSCLSHGLVVGPLVRVIYFSVAAYLVARCIAALANRYFLIVDRAGILRHAGFSLTFWLVHHPMVFIAALIGLVLGGLTHTLADVLSSFWKKVW
jgi:uncharacterized metal-binding protein